MATLINHCSTFQCRHNVKGPHMFFIIMIMQFKLPVADTVSDNYRLTTDMANREP